MGKERARREALTLIRLHIVVEGQTEEAFVNDVLAPELGGHRIFIDAHRITTGRLHGNVYRGGWDTYKKLITDLVLWMKEDRAPDAWFSTMVDAKLAAIREQFSSPEEINDGDETAPSKRIETLLPDFVKPVSGVLIANKIGLPKLRAECAHFDRWVARLLELPAL